MPLNKSLYRPLSLLYYFIISADGVVLNEERKLYERAFAKFFDINRTVASELLSEAKEALSSIYSISEIATHIKPLLNYKERVQVMVSLWEISVSDGLLDVVEYRYLKILARHLEISSEDIRKIKSVLQKSGRKFSEGKGASVPEYEKHPNSWILNNITPGMKATVSQLINGKIVSAPVIIASSKSKLSYTSVIKLSGSPATSLSLSVGDIDVVIYGISTYRSGSCYLTAEKLVVINGTKSKAIYM